MKKTLFLFVAVLLLVSSCKYSDQYQTVNAANKFSVAVPSWMKEDKELKPGADFQYANHYRNFCLAVQARRNQQEARPEWLDFPGIKEGVRGMLFIEKVIESGRSEKKWVSVE